jgi:hypothetical protein
MMPQRSKWSLAQATRAYALCRGAMSESQIHSMGWSLVRAEDPSRALPPRLGQGLQTLLGAEEPIWSERGLLQAVFLCSQSRCRSQTSRHVSSHAWPRIERLLPTIYSSGSVSYAHSGTLMLPLTSGPSWILPVQQSVVSLASLPLEPHTFIF